MSQSERESSFEYFDAVDTDDMTQSLMKELVEKERQLARRERELKKLLVAERRCESKDSERQYRLEREVRQLRRKFLNGKQKRRKGDLGEE